jgi:hypothetical protein
MKKVYIAGKISGLDFDEVKKKFNEAENLLKDKGYDTFNPINLSDNFTTWTEGMKECIKQLLECDAIYLMNDWRLSRGATLEKIISNFLGIEVIEEGDNYGL